MLIQIGFQNICSVSFSLNFGIGTKFVGIYGILPQHTIENMRNTKYQYTLSDNETKVLRDTIKKGKSSARVILHANILLAGDCSTAIKSVKEISEAFDTTSTTVYNVLSMYKKEGVEPLLKRKKRLTPPVEAKITGDIEAKIIALACSEAPEGCARWTLTLLADRAVKLGYIDSISRSSVHNVLKKTK